MVLLQLLSYAVQVVSVLSSMYRLGSLLIVVLGFFGGAVVGVLMVHHEIAEFDHRNVYCTLLLCTVLEPPRDLPFPDLSYNRRLIFNSDFNSDLLFLLIFRD